MTTADELALIAQRGSDLGIRDPVPAVSRIDSHVTDSQPSALRWGTEPATVVPLHGAGPLPTPGMPRC